MKKTVLKVVTFILLLNILVAPRFLMAQDEIRYFDTAPKNQDEILIAVCYPSFGSLRALIELRKKGLLNIPNLLVVGVYHEQENTDYSSSRKLVKNNYIDWIKFHVVRGEINQKNLFMKNDLTKEFKQIFLKSDGIIFFGGADIPPYVYGKKTHLLSAIRTTYRSFYEVSFIFHLLGGSQNKDFKPFLESVPDYPVLGICLGEQSLNVGTGGTLAQDIWKEIYKKEYLEDVIKLPESNWHSNPYARLYPEKKFFPYKMHPIKLDPESKFVKEFGFKSGDKPYILSAHHQAANKIGHGFKTAATSLDGKVIEAIEHIKYPNVLGVQFHPEFPLLYSESSSYIFTPESDQKTSILSLLQNNPPSLKFHKKIWAWFSSVLSDFHKKKSLFP